MTKGFKLDCFKGKACRDYFAELKSQLCGEIESLKDVELAKTSRDQWLAYYREKYQIEPVVFSDTDFDLSVSETKIQEYNHWSRMDRDEPQYYLRDGYSVSCKTPFTGNACLLKLQPSTFTLSKFTASINQDNQTGEQWLILNYSIVLDKADPESIRGHFVSTIESFEKEVGPNNTEARNWNKQIESIAGSCLDDRTSRLDKFNSLKKSLNIPLKPSPGTTNLEIPIKKKTLRRPKPSKNSEPNYSITDSDFSAITKIIDAQCASFEIAPSSYYHLGEEQLRDIVLAMLNTHYEQGATGETFRGKGKTDINILFENHAAYIAECKLWKGPAAVTKAIDQLYGYLTWRDTKVSLIIFNKDIRDFSLILAKLDQALSDRNGKTRRIAENQWEHTEDSADSSTSIRLMVQVYNLYSKDRSAV